MNSKNTKNNKCFQYAIIAALNHQNIDPRPERISKLRPFIDNYDWTEREFQHTQRIGENLNVTIRQLL